LDGSLLVPRPAHPVQTRRRHAAETLRLAGPLAVAQLAGMAMGVTDTVLLGTLGGDALAAGGLATMLFITVTIMLQGMLTAVSVVVSQERGAGRDDLVAAPYWAGLGIALLLCVPAFVVFSLAEPLLLLAGQPAELVRDAAAFMDVLRWAAPGAMVGIGMMRAFLPAIGQGAAMLWVALGATGINAALCWGMIHGSWGLPALGMRGPALATVLVETGMGLVLMAWLHGRPGLRRFVAWRRPGPALLRRMLALGLPVTGTFAVETGLFLGIGLLVGRLGAGPLAAHQIALSIVSVSFMVPLALAQAANVRVGNRVGAGDLAGARRAGLVAIGLAGLTEAVAAAVLLLAPGLLAGLYVDPALPGNAEAFATATGLLAIAAAFQVADGVQSAAGGALRGLGDTQVPFLLAAAGYWGVGFPAAWWLTARAGAGAAGAWWGLAGGLMLVAVLLTGRFLRRSRGAVAG
jgi:MATE family multidrug resistance protein